MGDEHSARFYRLVATKIPEEVIRRMIAEIKADGRTKKRRVIPDGFFTIRRPHVSNPGVMEELAFLLEIDLGTEDNPRFAREKVRPGVAYLKNEAYRARFGLDYGRWLVVTASQTRSGALKGLSMAHHFMGALGYSRTTRAGE